MYNLHKIIIMGNFRPDDQQGLETVVMETYGMKILRVLYINDINSLRDKGSIKNEIISSLYADSYNPDDLKIKLYEAINGIDAMDRVIKFIVKRWDPDTITYYYDPDDDCYDYIENQLRNIDSSIYIDEYENIYDGKDTKKDIYEIMAANNLKLDNLIKDDKISMIYFLSGLVEKLFSK